IADPPLARFLFSDTRMAVVWLVLRIYVGFSWLDAGLHKVLDAGAKTNYIYDGSGLLAFWQRIAAIPAAPAKPVITYDWYRNFIQFMVDNHWEVFFGKLIAFGETAVGIGLILGAFVGIAAVGGAFELSTRCPLHEHADLIFYDEESITPALEEQLDLVPLSTPVAYARAMRTRQGNEYPVTERVRPAARLSR